MHDLNVLLILYCPSFSSHHNTYWHVNLKIIKGYNIINSSQKTISLSLYTVYCKLSTIPLPFILVIIVINILSNISDQMDKCFPSIEVPITILFLTQLTIGESIIKGKLNHLCLGEQITKTIIMEETISEVKE